MADKNILIENVHLGHRKRLRDKFLRSGFDSFDPHQILEMILFYTCPRKDTNELAHLLLKKFGSISDVFDADIENLIKIPGITENTAILFKIITNSSMIYTNNKAISTIYDSYTKIKNMFIPLYSGITTEQFMIACFNNNLKLVDCKVIFTGQVSTSAVDTRKIVEYILGCKSTLVAFAHNHPNGELSASAADVQSTRIINSTLKCLGISLLDHIIIAQNSAISMRDKGILTAFDWFFITYIERN